MKENVAILGASDHPERFSHKAQVLLKKKGYNPILVNPNHQECDGLKCYSTLDQIKEKIHTLTVYINPHLSSQIKKEILNFKCERVVFNPGTENPDLYDGLKKKGVEIVEKCTLVMLNSGDF
ncbi:MAG: CoA-binding protein [Bacteriovoracales bacterium]